MSRILPRLLNGNGLLLAFMRLSNRSFHIEMKGTWNKLVALVLPIVVMNTRAVLSAPPHLETGGDPIAFARERLNDADGNVRALALSAVSSVDTRAQYNRLISALDDPSDSVQGTALKFLKEFPIGENSTKIHRYFKSVAEKAKCALATDPASADPFIIEAAAVELFLAAGNEKDHQLAVAYLRTALSEKWSLPRWLSIADLVSRYKLKELEPLLEKSAHEQRNQAIVSLELIKIGNEDSLKLARKSIGLKPWTAGILNDFALVKRLGLKAQDVRPYLSSDSYETRTSAAVALSHFGDAKPLHDILADLLTEMKGQSRGEFAHAVLTLKAIGESGDSSFIPTLREYFQKNKETELKLQAAIAVAQIDARNKREHAANR